MTYTNAHLSESFGMEPARRHVMLSIVMPAYNEGRTIARAIEQVLDIPYPCPMELIVVDDGSRDDTAGILDAIEDPRVVTHRHASNQGKGAALLSGIALAQGTHIVPFDADLEYAPRDLLPLLDPVIRGRADIVYGSRLFGSNTVYQSYRYAMGNKMTTLVANVLFDSYISDLHTCLKLVPVELLRDLALSEQGFGLDTEITARLLKAGHRPFEVPVSYHSRTHAQGKHLNWRDGVACLGILFRVRSQRTKSDPEVRPAPRHERQADLHLVGQS
jgi:dolichol-phosphate hexosyltransferase